MNEENAVTVSFDLDEITVWALAQFLKRIGFTAIRECAESNDDAYVMEYGLDAVRRAIADAGYAPR